MPKKVTKKSRKKAEIVDDVADNEQENIDALQSTFVVQSRTGTRKGLRTRAVPNEIPSVEQLPFPPPPPPPPVSNEDTGVTATAVAASVVALSEDSSLSEEDVEEKEKRRIKKQIEANPFSFKNYVQKVSSSATTELADLNGVNLSAAPSTDDVSETTSSYEESVSQLKQTVLKLTDDLEHSEHLLKIRTKRVHEVELALKEMREKEVIETASLNKRFNQLQKAYKDSQNRVRELESELRLKGADGDENFGASSNVGESGEEFQQRLKPIVGQMRTLSCGAQQQLKTMLSEVDKLNQLLDVAESLHKFQSHSGAAADGVGDHPQ